MGFLQFAIYGIALCIILTPFYSYCLVDSRAPKARPGALSIILSMGPAIGIGMAAARASSEKNPSLLQYSLIFLGMLYSAAYIDPKRIDRLEDERLVHFCAIKITEHLRRILSKKIMSAIIAIIASLTLPHYWNYIGLLLILHLLYYKMASCIENEAGVGVWSAPKEIKERWEGRAVIAAVTMGILLIGPFQIIKTRGYVPDSWEAFAGLGLGSLITASSMLAASVLADLLRHH